MRSKTQNRPDTAQKIHSPSKNQRVAMSKYRNLRQKRGFFSRLLGMTPSSQEPTGTHSTKKNNLRTWLRPLEGPFENVLQEESSIAGNHLGCELRQSGRCSAILTFRVM